MPLNTTRIRTLAAIAAILTIAAGLAVRKWLPWGFWSKYSGVALWSMLVYVLVVFVRPRINVIRAAVITLFISWAVEFLQLTPVSGWLSSQHPVLRLIFGEHFNFRDLLAYPVGVLAAAVTHAAIATRMTRA